MTIGERIKKLRLENGLTQEELGKEIGTIKQTVNKYENGTITNIPTDKIEIMASVFGVSEAFIMGWEEKDEYEPHTIAAHKNDPNSEWSEEELKEIEEFKEFVKMKRLSKKQDT